MISALEGLVREVITTVEYIHPQLFTLIWHWHSKHSAEFGVVKPKPFDERDSYERADQYNPIGIAVLFMLKLNESFNETEDVHRTWNVPQSHLFTYELMQYFLNGCLKTKSDTLVLMAVDCAQKLAYLNQGQEIGKLCFFHRDE